MPADPLLGQDLTSLREELGKARRTRETGAQERREAAAATEPPANRAADDESILSLVDEIAAFFAEAERNIAAHPAASMVGALVIGIAIGRMLGRR